MFNHVCSFFKSFALIIYNFYRNFISLCLFNFHIRRISNTKFCFWYLVNLSKLVKSYYPWNHQKTIDFLVDSGKTEVNLLKFRSSHRRCSTNKGIVKIFSIFPGKHLCQRLWHRSFPVNFDKFLRISFLQNTSRWLLL